MVDYGDDFLVAPAGTLFPDSRKNLGVMLFVNAVPARTTKAPMIVLQPICSSRKRTPHKIPNTGIKNVTDSAEIGPMSRISRK